MRHGIEYGKSSVALTFGMLIGLALVWAGLLLTLFERHTGRLYRAMNIRLWKTMS